MTALVVFLAPPGPIAVLRELLHDLNTAGLVDPFVWATVERRPAPGEALQVVRVADGRARATTLQQLLVRAQGIDRVRLVSLIPVLDDHARLDEEAAQEILAQLGQSLGSVPVYPARLLLTRVGEQATAPLGRDGWHNILVAPEESAAPSGARRLITAAGTDIVEFGRHAVVTVAALTGLWTGAPDSPLDGPSVGRSVRLARSYLRRLQTGRAEDALRSQVLGLAGGLPLPVDGMRAAQYIPDAGVETRRMADAVWRQHQSVLFGPRERPARRSQKPIGFLESLKLLVTFLGAAVVNAPRNWARRTLTRGKAALAGAVGSFVFGGSDSVYKVVVGGVTAEGIPASWLDLSEAVDDMYELVETGLPPEPRAPDDFTELWKDYVAGALTLVDGGTRDTDLPAAELGGQIAVLRSTDSAVPTRSTRFTEVPGPIAAEVQMDGVDAADIFGIITFGQRLIRTRDERGVDVGGVVQALKDWRQVHETSYALQVGSQLVARIREVRDEIKALLEKIQAAESADRTTSEEEKRQKRNIRVQQILLAVLVIGLIVVGVLLGLGVIVLGLALVIGGAILLAWLIAAPIAFFVGQREAFRLENLRRAAAGEEAVLRPNLRSAVRDLRRLLDAYMQYLAWSKVLAVLLENPLGQLAGHEVSEMPLRPELPASARIGIAQVAESELAEMSAELRRRLFSRGWLSESWEGLIGNAASALGPAGFELVNDEDGIFALTAKPDSLLTKWVGLVESGEAVPIAATGAWERLQTLLDADGGRMSTRLFGRISDIADPTAPTVDFATFMAGIDGAAEVQGSFDASPVKEGSRLEADLRIAQPFTSGRRSGLLRVHVLTQLSPGVDAYLLVAHEETVVARPDIAPPDFAI